MTNHEPDCIQYRIELVAAKIQHLDCIVDGCDGSVGRNKDDFFECRKCRTQFCASEIATMFDLAPLDAVEEFLSDPSSDRQFIKVVRLTKKGKGEFPLDEGLAELAAIRDEKKAALKD